MNDSANNTFESLFEIRQNIKNERFINEGWSTDFKTHVSTKKQDYLIRKFDKKRYEERLNQASELKKLEELNLPISKFYEIEEYESKVYMSFEWIEGENLSNLITEFTEIQQYNLGYEAGNILKMIHSIKIDEDKNYNWEDKFNKKIDSKLNAYKNCKIKYKNDDLIIGEIEKYRHLLKDRPITFQHGDYHIGNMMMDKNNRLVIIDFDRADYGDPWEEFNRIVWSVQASQHFASGLINGYFKNDVPKEFWRLLKLYILTNTLSSLPWSIQFGVEQVETMLAQCTEIIEYYENFQLEIPKWYKGDSNVY